MTVELSTHATHAPVLSSSAVVVEGTPLKRFQQRRFLVTILLVVVFTVVVPTSPRWSGLVRRRRAAPVWNDPTAFSGLDFAKGVVDDLRNANDIAQRSAAMKLPLREEAWCRHAGGHSTFCGESRRGAAFGYCEGHRHVPAVRRNNDCGATLQERTAWLYPGQSNRIPDFCCSKDLRLNPRTDVLDINLKTRGKSPVVGHFYRVKSLCVSTVGRGLSAHVPERLWPNGSRTASIQLDRLIDERRSTIRDLAIRQRLGDDGSGLGACMLDAAIVHPMLGQSDNLGHVMYRVAATMRLKRRLALVEPRFKDAVVVFYVTRQARQSFGSSNMYGAFAALIGPDSMVAIAPFDGDSPIDASVNEQAAAQDVPEDVCFAHAVVGWDPVVMYSGKVAQQRVDQLRLTLPELRMVRSALAACFGTAHEWNRVANTRVATIVTRRTRTLENADEVASKLVSLLEVADPRLRWTVRVVDFATLTIPEQAMVAATSDMLLGTHGTALQWSLMMRPDAVMVEIQNRGYGCSSPGINPPDRRQCEFGPSSIVANVTHIVLRAEREQSRCAPKDQWQRRLCNTTLRPDDLSRIAQIATCALVVGFSDAAKCDDPTFVAVVRNSPLGKESRFASAVNDVDAVVPSSGTVHD